MAIRNFCDVPDDQVPEWVLRRREAARRALRYECSCGHHFGSRGAVLFHCEATGHPPRVTTPDDPYLRRIPTPGMDGTPFVDS